MSRLAWVLMPLLIAGSGCSSSQQALPASLKAPYSSSAGPPASAAASLAAPIQDARAFAESLGRIAEANGDAEDLGMGDEAGDLGVREAWVEAGWPSEGFGPATPTAIDLHPLRGADTVDVPFVAYAVRDTKDRCFLGAVTYSPAGTRAGRMNLISVIVPGLSYRECSSQVAAEEFGSIVGTMHGDQP